MIGIVGANAERAGDGVIDPVMARVIEEQRRS